MQTGIIYDWDAPLIWEQRLAKAMDERYMRRRFEQTLQHGPVRECRIARVRRRGDQRAVIQYSLQWEATVGQAAVITANLYRGDRARHLVRKLSKQIPAELLEQCPVFPVFGIPELRMLCQVFPMDRRLPGLAHLAAGPPRELLADMRAEVGVGDTVAVRSRGMIDGLEVRRTSVVRYRSGLSAVMRYDLDFTTADGGCETRSFFAKTQQEISDAETLATKLRALRQLPTPLIGEQLFGLYPQWHAVVLRGVEGETLEALLQRGDASSCAERLARGLASLHNATPPSAIPKYDSARQDAQRDRIAAKLAWACPDLAERIHHIAERVRGITSQHFAPAHLDLKLEHVFLAGDRLTLIDWDSCAMADPMIDVAMLLARLAAAPVQANVAAGNYEAAARRFLHTYCELTPTTWRSSLGRRYTAAVLDVAVGYFGRQEPRWKETVTHLLREAETALGEPAIPEQAALSAKFPHFH